MNNEAKGQLLRLSIEAANFLKVVMVNIKEENTNLLRDIYRNINSDIYDLCHKYKLPMDARGEWANIQLDDWQQLSILAIEAADTLWAISKNKEIDKPVRLLSSEIYDLINKIMCNECSVDAL